MVPHNGWKTQKEREGEDRLTRKWRDKCRTGRKRESRTVEKLPKAQNNAETNIFVFWNV